MALPMPRPFEHKNGTYYINVRMPAGLPLESKGASVLFPVGDAMVAARVTDKVFCSLKTKDPTVARHRFTLA